MLKLTRILDPLWKLAFDFFSRYFINVLNDIYKHLSLIFISICPYMICMLKQKLRIRKNMFIWAFVSVFFLLLKAKGSLILTL